MQTAKFVIFTSKTYLHHFPSGCGRGNFPIPVAGFNAHAWIYGNYRGYVKKKPGLN